MPHPDDQKDLDLNFNPDEWASRTKIPPPRPDSMIDKWRRWADRIRREMIAEIFTNREAFRAVREVLSQNPNIPGSDIIGYWAGNYARSQSVAVRRQTDISSQVVSFGRLLRELEAKRFRLTRSWYVGHYEWGHQGRGDSDFDQWAFLDPEKPDESESGNELSLLRIRHDIERLEAAAAPIRHYVDRAIAHADSRPPRTVPTFDDLDRAIDVLGGTFASYYTLLTSSAMVHLYATPQYDRLAPLRQPWIPG